jgi:iron complex outermembrane receptor protein
MHNPTRQILTAASAILLLALAAPAQTNPTAPAKADETVELSPFVVSTEHRDGYIASESVTGTRVKTQIKDLPFSVSVITSEFMNDFDFFDLGSDLAYTASLNSVDTQGNSTLRGYGATFMLRNGFYRLGLIDRVNTDRIEIIKGPNAAIYGSTSPAGLINVVSKLPRATPYERVQGTFGSLNMQRGEINVNTPLGTVAGINFSQLISAEAQDNDTATQYAHNKNRVFGYDLLARFNDGSTLNFEFDWSKRTGTADTGALPFEYNIKTKTYSSILRPDLAHFSQAGPNSIADRKQQSIYLTYDKQYNRVWSTHAGFNAYHRKAFNFNNGTRDQFDPSTNQFTRPTVVTDPLNEDGFAVQVDTLAHYPLMNGKIDNKTLFTFDVSNNWRFRQQNGVNTKLYTIPTINITAPDYSLPPLDAFNIVTRRDHVRWHIEGLLLRQQVMALDNKLIGFAGLRFDRVTYNLNFGDQFNTGGSNPGSLKTAGQVLHYTDTAFSPNFGFNYKLTPHIALYASHSKSFSPSGQVAKLGTPRLDNETSIGWDYGIKASYLNDRLIFTTGGYYIDRYGVKTTQTDPTTGLSETVAAGTQRARGFEFEGSWSATDELTFLASYSIVGAKIVYNGDSVTDVGRPPAGLPESQASLAWKYNFRKTVLKGFAWNGGLTYSGRSYFNSTATDARRNVYAAGSTLVNTGLTYTWKGENGFTHSIRVSAKNLLDRVYVTNNGNLGNDRAYYVAYTLNH